MGIKHAALASDPVQYLINFGETDTLSEQDLELAEKYLVYVWAGIKSSTTAATFNQLRLDNYTSVSAGIDSLPPTSSLIRGHIHRGDFLVHRACNLLEVGKDCETRIDPVEHGWEESFGTLLTM